MTDASNPAAMTEHRDIRVEYTDGEHVYHVRETPCDYTSRRTWYFEEGTAVCRQVDRSPWPSCTA